MTKVDERPFIKRMEAAGCTFIKEPLGTLVSKKGYETKMITVFDRISYAEKVTRYYETPLIKCK